MQITNESSVHAPLETLWDVLNDVERVAPFVPGFVLQEAEGDTYRGTVKVKVGAVTASYNAEIEVLERDEQARRVVMSVAGRERRGPGSMNADVTSVLAPRGDATQLSLSTDLQVTGRVAQFGSGVLADVAGNLLDRFAAALEDGVIAADGAGNGAGAGPPRAGAGAAQAPAGAPAQPPGSGIADLTAAARGSLARRAAPVLLGAAAIAVAGYLIGRRR